MYDLTVDIYYNDTAKNIDNNCRLICSWLLDNKCSIRDCSKEINLSKSQIHRLIHSYIRYYYNEEYYQILKLLQWNKRERFKPKKYWKFRPW